MSNRARRAHTHTLRRRLVPDPTPTVTIRLQFEGSRSIQRAQCKLRDAMKRFGLRPSSSR